MPGSTAGASRQAKWRGVGIFTLLATATTLVGPWVRVPQVDINRLFVPAPGLFPRTPRIKGVKPPNLDSLDFQNTNSRDNVRFVLKQRGEPNAQSQEIAERVLRKILDDERHNPSDLTRAYLRAMHGQLLTDHGRVTDAIQELEGAHRIAPQDPVIKTLLLRAYEVAHDQIENRATPWPLHRQQELRSYHQKIQRLRDELLPFLDAATTLRNDPAMAGPHSAIRLVSGGLTIDVVRDSLSDEHTRRATAKAFDGRLVIHFSRADEAPRFAVASVTGSNLQRTLLNHDGGSRPVRWTTNRTQLDQDDPGFGGAERSELATHGARRALLIGIGNYLEESGFERLSFARSDALQGRQAIARLGYATSVLTDRAATRNAILGRLLQEVTTSRPGDDFLLYYSGHGFEDNSGLAALVTAADDGEPASVLPLAEIAEILSFHRGTATVILDTCLNKLNVDLEASDAPGPYGRNHATIIAATSPGGQALEAPDLGAGLYTYTVVHFMDREVGTARHAQRPYRIHVNTLFAATSEETRRLAGKLYGREQQPVTLPPRTWTEER